MLKVKTIRLNKTLRTTLADFGAYLRKHHHINSGPKKLNDVYCTAECYCKGAKAVPQEELKALVESKWYLAYVKACNALFYSSTRLAQVALGFGKGVDDV